jgi:hypothetical protein
MLSNMRILATTLLASALIATQARSEPLSSADREALLESLEKIRENADSKVDARFRLAIAAYREAMTTDDAAMEFYLKCIEKVNFEDQQKKNSEFREWKRREGDKLSEQGYRLALRYQLRWLILTLRAASEKTRSSDLVNEAQEVVDSIFRDAVKLGEHGQTLGQPVTSTVFARAYEIGNVENAKWPLSPIQLEQVYNEIIFPLYRNPTGIASLRAAWIKRIQQEGLKEEAMGGNGGGGRRNGPQPPREGDKERFVMETLPELQWQMELDLFRSGDEGGAAVRMLEHIQKHLNHRSAREWGDQFKNLLSPKPAPAAATAGE